MKLGCIIHCLILLDMSLQQTPCVPNSTNRTWFSKALTCLFKVPEFTVQCQNKTKVIRFKRISHRMETEVLTHWHFPGVQWLPSNGTTLKPDFTLSGQFQRPCKKSLNQIQYVNEVFSKTKYGKSEEFSIFSLFGASWCLSLYITSKHHVKWSWRIPSTVCFYICKPF